MSVYARVTVAAALALTMCAGVLTVPGSLSIPLSALAGHDDPLTSHLTESGRIARNVVLGRSILVCSDELPISAGTAARRWNGLLDPTDATKVFAYNEQTGRALGEYVPPCSTAQSDVGISKVVVHRWYRRVHGSGPSRRTPCNWADAVACIFLNETPADEEWDTFVGRIRILVVAMRDRNGEIELDPTQIPTTLTDGAAEETYWITHELGHVFGLADYKAGFCVSPANLPAGGGIINYVFPSTPSVMAYDDECDSLVPAARDLRDFRLSYEPTTPTILTHGSPGVGRVTLTWDASDVHVESGFAIQREVRADGRPSSLAWTTVQAEESLGASAGTGMAELSDQPPGEQKYRVVSLTRAPAQSRLAASQARTIPVQGTPGAPASLSSTAGDGTLTLMWAQATDVPPITGYEYSLGTSDVWVPITPSDHGTTQHVLRGLTNGTEYTVRLRAVRGAVKGHEASITDTPRVPPSPPPPSTTTLSIVAGIQTIVWPGDDVAVATAVAGHPIVSVWYRQEDGTWVVYIPGAPDFVNSLDTLETGETYAIRAREAFSWTIQNASSQGTTTNEEARAEADPTSTPWTTTVTCGRGRSPVRLGAAPTEAAAVAAATWFIAQEQGCGGDGTYTTSQGQ